MSPGLLAYSESPGEPLGSVIFGHPALLLTFPEFMLVYAFYHLHFVLVNKPHTFPHLCSVFLSWQIGRNAQHCA